MSHHCWGDPEFDWKGLAACERILHSICVRRGRIGGTIKEKYGELRYYATFWAGTLFELFYPGYHYYPTWYRRFFMFDQYTTPLLARITGLRYLIHRYQVYMYRRGYASCLKAYPLLREEILNSADYPEYLADL